MADPPPTAAIVYSGAGERYRPEYLTKSPLAKVPCLQTDAGFISESRCIIDYRERAYPAPALYPSSPFQIAKLIELTQIIDLYLELTTRRVLPNFFARKPPPDSIANDVRATLTKGANAVAKLASCVREAVHANRIRRPCRGHDIGRHAHGCFGDRVET